MASVRIRRSDVNALPFVCIHCGEAAAQRQQVEFVWHPWWGVVFARLLGPLGTHLLARLEMRMHLRVPACANHQARSVWQPHTFFKFGALLLFALGAAGLVLANGQEEWTFGLNSSRILAGLLVTAVAYLGFAAFVRSCLVRPTHMDERTIDLAGVSERFALAHQPAKPI